jgi:16S rRNA (adenine1518-N6/adenine1519-N6)-dimethyltransferase
MSTPLKILKKYGIQATKSLGQSFLIDNNITAKIVDSAGIEKSDIVVEIGAGPGMMTRRIADKAGKVVAIEIDSRMVEVLRQELGAQPNVHIVAADVLDYDFSSVAENEEGSPSHRIKVIGNIPYNISSQILFRLIEYRQVISSVTLMFQREVAERIMASPGSREYGILSVLTLMYMVPSKVMTVPASCFYPKPRVESMVLTMDVRTRPLCEACDYDTFRQVVRSAFAKRRKTLVNSLKESAFIRDLDIDLASILGDLEIDPKRRGETLSVEEFARLSRTIEASLSH